MNSEWTADDERACEDSFKQWALNDARIDYCEERLSYIVGNISEGSLAEEKTLRSEIEALKKENDQLGGTPLGQANTREKNEVKKLDVFKNMKKLTANEVTVWLLHKDENSLPDRVRIGARKNKQTVFFSDLGLVGKCTGILNRAGAMLFALAKNTTPENLKAPEQAMVELRKIFRGIGIIDKDPFMPKKASWSPRFTLKDEIENADKRAADRAVHVQLDENLKYDQEEDEAARFLREHDNKSTS